MVVVPPLLEPRPGRAISQFTAPVGLPDLPAVADVTETPLLRPDKPLEAPVIGERTVTGTLHNLTVRHDGSVYATITNPQSRAAVLFPADLVARHPELITFTGQVTVTGDTTTETLHVENMEVQP